jgi:hypothetical protein
MAGALRPQAPAFDRFGQVQRLTDAVVIKVNCRACVLPVYGCFLIARAGEHRLSPGMIAASLPKQ